ncbi:MAG: alpha/beta hydrolase [Spirochaetota bacterium]
MRRLPVLFAVPFALVLGASLAPVQSLYLPSPDLVRRLVAESEAKPPAPPVVHRDVVYDRSLLRAHRLDVYEPTALWEPATGGGEAGATGERAGRTADTHGRTADTHGRTADTHGRTAEAVRPPVVVFFHGGSWIQGDKITIRVVDRFLARMREAGYFVVAVNYTTSIARGLVGPVENARRALRWVVRQADAYGWDSGNVGLYGVSAGGHVALMAASTAELAAGKLAFAFIECAPTDLVAMREGDAYEQSGVFRLFPESRLRELSPVTHVHADLPPILIFHGGRDRTVAMNQSELYVDALREVGGRAELVRYPEGDHAFLNLPDETWYEQESRALDFFDRAFSRRPE